MHSINPINLAGSRERAFQALGAESMKGGELLGALLKESPLGRGRLEGVEQGDVFLLEIKFGRRLRALVRVFFA